MRSRGCKLPALGLGLALMACGRLEVPDPSILSVTPNTFPAGATPEIEVLGDNFFAAASVDLNSSGPVHIDTAFGAFVGAARVPASNVIIDSPRRLRFQFPNGINPGPHKLTIVTPEGKSAALERAFTLTQTSMSGGSGGGPQLMSMGGTGTVTSGFGGNGSTSNVGGASSGSGGLTSGAGSGGQNATGGQPNGSTGTGGRPSSGGTAGVVELVACSKFDYNATTYVFCPNKETMPQAAAKATCEAAGMTLVRIDSDGENTFVGSTADSLSIDGLWLQASDQASEGVWIWQDGTQFWAGDDDGAPILGLYNNWERGAGTPQPNDNSPAPGEDCAIMDTNAVSGFSWFDAECTIKLAMVCEKPP
ncbi:MAG: C-type lectin domain-containing protein [Polyangiaceae bacterium]|nr:C-type lectin domain-containing protein [Polyangiaceae bacterium]